jgi:hypothetical protein
MFRTLPGSTAGLAAGFLAMVLGLCVTTRDAHADACDDALARLRSPGGFEPARSYSGQPTVATTMDRPHLADAAYGESWPLIRIPPAVVPPARGASSPPPASASATPTPAEPEIAAQALYQQGQDALKRGDCPGAARLFGQALATSLRDKAIYGDWQSRAAVGNLPQCRG